MAQIEFSQSEQEAATNSKAHTFSSFGNAYQHLLNLDESKFDHQFIRSGGYWIIAIKSNDKETLEQAARYGYFIVNSEG